MIKVRNAKDVIAGVLFALIGLAALWFARSLEYGTARQMGSGFIPRWLAAILLLLGIAIAARGVLVGGGRLGELSLRRLTMIMAAIVVFGVSVTSLGLVMSTFACALIAAMAGNEFRRVEAVTLGIALAAFSAAVFVYGLRLPFPLWPGV